MVYCSPYCSEVGRERVSNVPGPTAREGRAGLESKVALSSPRVTTGCRALEALGREAQGETQLISSAACSETLFPHLGRGDNKAKSKWA